ncbi:MAG: prepilin peptidase [Alphaproteobacteria bacterium]|nr:prepilin peptidase [Alphaproteobacteria bacterium]
MVVWFLFGIILLLIAINDFLFFRIEDEPVFALFGLYVIACLFRELGNEDWIFTVSVAVIIFVITLILNRFDMIGGGDVKLLFPLILFSESKLYVFLMAVSVAGIVLALVYVLFSKRIFELRKKIIQKLMIIRKKRKKIFLLNIVLLSLSRITNRAAVLNYNVTNIWQQEIPYGIALSYGGFCVILENLLSR